MSRMEKNFREFAVSRLGASHLKSGKPCQDSSLSWRSDDDNCFAVVVADGHGGDTYVRSDIGARIAVEVALVHIKEAITNPRFITLIKGRKGAVTARPDGPRRIPKDPAERTTIQQELIRQDHLFFQQVSSIKEQDSFFQDMFGSIVREWSKRILQDNIDNPFTDSEKLYLGSNRIEKAYGSTLMAFAMTPEFWMAFHLGDGKMLMSDYTGQWSEPVPWDCNCFLNITTSLCNSNPVNSFRYAFDATGKIPAAVMMGSDGMDDSWGTMDNLKDFYSKVLSIFYEDEKEKTSFEKTKEDLGDYLTRLSAQGSRDDMTMAGIIDMSKLGTMCGISQLRHQGKLLKEQRDSLDREFKKLQQAKDQELSDMQKDYESKFIIFKQECEKKIEERKLEIIAELNGRKEEIEKEKRSLRDKYSLLKEQAENLKLEAIQKEEANNTIVKILDDSQMSLNKGEINNEGEIDLKPIID